MTELSALAGSEGYAACGAKRSAGLHRPLMEPTKCILHFVGEEERGMTELSALAGSEGYAACDDDGKLTCGADGA